jgi:hypothetical protein
MSLLQKVLLGLLLTGAIAFLWARPGSALIQTQRSQIGINVVVNVTPSPIAYNPAVIAKAPAAAVEPIVARWTLRARGSQPSVDDEVLQGAGVLLAQASAQSALKVQATVTPNPNATLLTANTYSVSLSGVAGTTVTQSCMYTIQVDTTITSWTLREGLSASFSGTLFPGTDLANNSYLQAATPQPTSTPFVVYPSNWTVLAASGGLKTYCVDLTVTIPGNVPGGQYSTSAIYTVYY